MLSRRGAPRGKSVLHHLGKSIGGGGGGAPPSAASPRLHHRNAAAPVSTTAPRPPMRPLACPAFSALQQWVTAAVTGRGAAPRVCVLTGTHGSGKRTAVDHALRGVQSDARVMRVCAWRARHAWPGAACRGDVRDACMPGAPRAVVVHGWAGLDYGAREGCSCATPCEPGTPLHACPARDAPPVDRLDATAHRLAHGTHLPIIILAPDRDAVLQHLVRRGVAVGIRWAVPPDTVAARAGVSAATALALGRDMRRMQRWKLAQQQQRQPKRAATESPAHVSTLPQALETLCGPGGDRARAWRTEPARLRNGLWDNALAASTALQDTVALADAFVWSDRLPWRPALSNALAETALDAALTAAIPAPPPPRWYARLDLRNLPASAARLGDEGRAALAQARSVGLTEGEDTLRATTLAHLRVLGGRRGAFRAQLALQEWRGDADLQATTAAARWHSLHRSQSPPTAAAAAPWS